jgi:hypothetical protein
VPRQRASSTLRIFGLSRTSLALGIILILNHYSPKKKSGYYAPLLIKLSSDSHVRTVVQTSFEGCAKSPANLSWPNLALDPYQFNGCNPFISLPDAVDVANAEMTLLVNDLGRPFTDAGFGNWFRDRCLEAGVPGRAHGLRKLVRRSQQTMARRHTS